VSENFAAKRFAANQGNVEKRQHGCTSEYDAGSISGVGYFETMWPNPFDNHDPDRIKSNSCLVPRTVLPVSDSPEL
jgi:hypothetical protein